MDMNQQEFETALQTEGYAPAVRIEQPVGYAMGEHQHPFDAFAFVISGEIVIEVSGVAKAYPAGSTFRLAALTPHLENAIQLGVTYLAGRRAVA
jgi:quercetin dioxygenase-like cupin family protein